MAGQRQPIHGNPRTISNRALNLLMNLKKGSRTYSTIFHIFKQQMYDNGSVIRTSHPNSVFIFCSSRSGKQRKRKRKVGGVENQSREKERHHNLATNNVTDIVISTVDDCISAAPLNIKIHCDLPTPQAPIDVENGHMEGTFYGSRKRDDHDLKLSELKAAMSANMVDSDKKAVASNDLVLVYDVSKVDCVVGSNQESHSIGAKRRKSSRVKRFAKDAALSEDSEQGLKRNASTLSIEPTDRNEELELENPSLSGHSRKVSDITRIIKPVGYSVSVSNGIPDVTVTFLVLRFVVQHQLLFLCIVEYYSLYLIVIWRKP